MINNNLNGKVKMSELKYYANTKATRGSVTKIVIRNKTPENPDGIIPHSHQIFRVKSSSKATTNKKNHAIHQPFS